MPNRTDDMIWWDEDFFIETGKYVPGSEPKSSLMSGAFTTFLQPGLRRDMMSMFEQQSGMHLQRLGMFEQQQQQARLQAQFGDSHRPHPFGGLAGIIGGGFGF